MCLIVTGDQTPVTQVGWKVYEKKEGKLVSSSNPDLPGGEIEGPGVVKSTFVPWSSPPREGDEVDKGIHVFPRKENAEALWKDFYPTYLGREYVVVPVVCYAQDFVAAGIHSGYSAVKGDAEAVYSEVHLLPKDWDDVWGEKTPAPAPELTPLEKAVKVFEEVTKGVPSWYDTRGREKSFKDFYGDIEQAERALNKPVYAAHSNPLDRDRWHVNYILTLVEKIQELQAQVAPAMDAKALKAFLDSADCPEDVEDVVRKFVAATYTPDQVFEDRENELDDWAHNNGFLSEESAHEDCVTETDLNENYVSKDDVRNAIDELKNLL